MLGRVGNNIEVRVSVHFDELLEEVVECLAETMQLLKRHILFVVDEARGWIQRVVPIEEHNGELVSMFDRFRSRRER